MTSTASISAALAKTVFAPPASSGNGNGRSADRPESSQVTVPGDHAEHIKNMQIAVVDDEPGNCLIVTKYLRDAGFQHFDTTSDATKAMEMILRRRPDLIVLDVLMPEVSGLEILKALRQDPTTAHVPVLIFTTATDAEIRRTALELGATDFLPKPIDPNEMIPRVRNVLITKSYHDHLANQAERLEREVRKRTADLTASRQEVVHCLARAAEYRDDVTGLHVVRVGRFAGTIARQLGFDDSHVEILELAAQLHDVGKIAIPDAILKHPGKLDPEQFALMQKHCGVGKQVMRPLGQEDWNKLRSHAGLGADLLHVRSSPLLMLAAKIAQTHHERWDGTGYPLGLAGEDIPIEGRITAVADVFDALSSARPYKPAFPREKCFGILEEGRGTHFDPNVLDAFFECTEEIIKVQMEYMDVDQPASFMTNGEANS